jgi:integrase
MTSRLPPFIHGFLDRHGKPRHYLRRKGYPKVPIPGTPWSPSFMQAYETALAGQQAFEAGKAKARPGTMDALALSYFASPAFTTKADNSKRAYRFTIERFCRAHGTKLIAEMQSQHVAKLMHAFQGKPGAANQLRKCLRVMMQHAVAIGMRADDPTREVRGIRFKAKSHHAWTEGEIEQFEHAHPIGSKERLAMALLVYTGQRSGDVRRMGPQHLQGNAVRVTQEKTGTELLIPLHTNLREVIKATKIGHLAFIVTQRGGVYSGNSFFYWFKEACRAAGLPHCSAHGLRHAAARRMANAGASTSEIAAVTGHRSLGEVSRYTRSADQRKLAASAIAKVEQNESKPVANLDSGRGKPDRYGVEHAREPKSK